MSQNHKNGLNIAHMRVLAGIIIAIMVTVWTPLYAHADAGTVSGKVMELKEAVTIYSEKSADSAVIVTFKAGDVIFVTGDTGDGWLTVAYQGQIGYLSKTVGETDSSTGTDGAGEGDSATGSTGNGTHELAIEDWTEADEAAIDEELSKENIESSYLAEEVERYHRSVRNAIIWVSIIAVLIIAVIIVSIISYRRNNTEPSEEQMEKENKTKRFKGEENIAEDTDRKRRKEIDKEKAEDKQPVTDDPNPIDIIDLDKEDI